MLRKTLAFLLTFVLLISVISVAVFSVGAAIEPTYTATYTDDFSDAEVTAKYLEQTKYSGSEDTLPDGSTSFTVENGVLTPSRTANYSKYYPMFTFRDDSLPESALPQSFSVDITYSGYVNKNQSNNRIIAYYDAASGNALEFSFYRNNDANLYGIQHHLTGITADTTNTYGAYKTTTASSQWSSDWIADSNNRYTLTYNYFESDSSKILQLVAEFYFNGNYDTVKARRVVNIPVDSFEGFKFGIKAYTDTANIVTYDNLSLKYTADKTDEMLAAEFKERNYDILSKEEVTIDDLDAYTAAMSDYESITDGAKLLVAEDYEKLLDIYTEMSESVKTQFYNTHKTILDKSISDIKIADKNALYNALEEVAAMSEFETNAISEYISHLNILEGRFAELNKRYSGDDFENSSYTDKYFESSNASNVYTIENIGDSNRLAPPLSTSVYTTIKDEYWDYTRKVKSVSFDVYLESISTKVYFYSLYDPTTSLCNGLYLANRGTSFAMISASRQDSQATLNKVTVDGTYYQLSSWNNFSEDFGTGPQVYTVNIDYTYSTTTVDSDEVKVIMVYYTIYNSNGISIGSQRGIYQVDEYLGNKIAFSAGTSAVYYDNLKVVYENNDADAKAIADEFIAKHSILNKTYDELTSADMSGVNAAVAEYDSYDTLVQSYLTNEIELLNIQKEYISYIDTFSKINTNDINTYIDAYKLLKGGNNAFRSYCLELCNKVYDVLEKYSDEHYAENEVINILTVGHSMVAGQGASLSYPVQLQTMLNEEYGSGKFRVHNIGAGGAVVSTFLSEKNINRAENAHPDIVIILLGANEALYSSHYENFEENYKQLVDFYQSMSSAPSIIMCTDVYMAARNVDKIVADEKVFSEKLSLPLVDLNKLTVDTYNADLSALTAEYIASGNYADETEAQTAAETETYAKWFSDEGTHYTNYGYGIMAQGVFSALKNSYIDFNIEYADIKNVVCYDNDWDSSMQADIDTLVSLVASDADVSECMSVYNALSDIQKIRFETKYNDSYIALIDANNKSLAEIEAKAFKEEHNGILTAASYDLSSLSAYVAAEKDYEALSDTAKRMLASEKEVLDSAYEVIKPLAAEKLIENGVENAGDYTADMLLAANSKINTYTYAERNTASKVQEEIIAALKNKVEQGSAKKSLTKIMCVGDSLTVADRSSSWTPIPYTAFLQDKLGENYHVYNAGQSGRTFYGSVNNYTDSEYYTYAKNYNPDIVIIMLGTNDFVVRNYLAQSSEEVIADAYIDLINYFRGLKSAPQVVLATVPNCSYIDIHDVRENYNKAVALQKSVAKDLGLPILDMAALTSDWPAYDETLEVNYELSDTLHYSQIAYEEMADYTYSLIKDITSENVYGYLRNTDFATVNNKVYEEQNGEILASGTATTQQAIDLLKAYSRLENPAESTVSASYAVFENAGLTPDTNGGTIRMDTAKQNIAFYGTAPKAASEDFKGAYISKVGAVMQTYNYLAQSGDKELTLESKNSANGFISYNAGDTVGQEYRFTLTGTDVSSRWGYGIVSRVFTEYTFEDGSTFILYSNNTDANNPDYATGDFVEGACVRAVNDVLKNIAKALKEAAADEKVANAKGESFVCGDNVTISKYNGVTLADAYALYDTDGDGLLATAEETLYLLLGYSSVIYDIA